MQRRTFLTTGSMAAVGFGARRAREPETERQRRGGRRVILRAGEGVVGSHHPHDRRPAAASRRGLRAEGRQARRQAAGPQLRPRRRGHVARVGHRADGRGVRDRASGAAGGGHRLRIGRAHLRAAAAAPRLRRHDLRDGRAAERDVEHVARRVHAARAWSRPTGGRRSGTRSIAAPPTSPIGSCSCWPGRITACRGSTTTR